MMRVVVQAMVIVLLLHLLAVLGVSAWLVATNRVTRARLAEAKHIFELTVAEEKAQEEEAAKLAEEAAKQAEAVARAAGDVPQSTAEQLDAQRVRDELMLRQLERTRRELEDLRRNLQISRMRMERQQQDLVAAQQAVEAKALEIEQRLNEEGFQKAVALYETLPPKQVKQHFMTLMTGSKVEEVVTYLEAMEPRKAAGVLREFKNADEITRAVELTERLRARGSDLVKDLEDLS